MTWLPMIAIVGITTAVIIDGFRFRAFRKASSSPTDNRDEVARVTRRIAEPAHAARANCDLDLDEVDLPSEIQDIFNRTVNTQEKYLGRVAGRSCERFGLKDGDLYLGDRYAPGMAFKTGDFVVVYGKAAFSNVGRRIRKVIGSEGDVLTFELHEDGKPHKARAKDTVIAKISHILA